MLGQMLVEVLGKKHELVLTDRQEMDVTNELKVRKVIKFVKPDFIIHAAAYVDVEKAESEKTLCNKINVRGSANIAKTAKKVGATVIYVSTDYVFDGKKKIPYQEIDKANPLGIYAKSKLGGECEIIKNCPKHYILRIAWLFGECEGGRNFVQTMIDLAKKKPSIEVINDQIGSPTYTRDLAKVILRIVSSQLQVAGRRKTAVSCQPSGKKAEYCNLKAESYSLPYGIYNFSGKGETTRFGFTKEIFKNAKIKSELIPIATKDFFQKAPRPAYSYLDKTKIEKALGIKVRSWQAMLMDYFRSV